MAEWSKALCLGIYLFRGKAQIRSLQGRGFESHSRQAHFFFLFDSLFPRGGDEASQQPFKVEGDSFFPRKRELIQDELFTTWTKEQLACCNIRTGVCRLSTLKEFI